MSRTAAFPRTAVLALVAIASLVITLLAAPPQPAAAAVPELQGHDISWPQCPAGTGAKVGGSDYGPGYGNPMPTNATDFVIVGLTDGLPFYRNHCLADQVSFIKSNGLPAGAYTMAGYPTAAQLTKYGTAGPRTGTSLATKLYNTGYAMAQFDIASLKAVGLSVPWVWIDVESRPKAPTPPNWPANNAANNRTVLQGIAAGFAAAGIKTGWYSVQSSWTNITGGWQDKAPMWKAGNYDTSVTGYARARSICPTASLNGGPIYLAQAVWGSYDLDVTCPALPSYATIFRPAPALTALTASTTWAELGDVALTYRATLAARQDWSATLVDLCSSATVRSWNGRGVGSVALPWDGTTSAGTPAPVGLYELRFSSAGTTRTATTELSSPGSRRLGTCPVTRTYGADRYATAVAIARTAAPSATRVVLASGESSHLVDGLVAAPLARASSAALLLTTGGALPPAVRADLVARGVTDVTVVGGPTAVSAAVVAELEGLGATVTRVAGADRYTTSVEVAKALAAAGGATDRVAWIGSGEQAHLVDSLAAGGPAAAAGQPILLTARTVLPASVAAQLKTQGTTGTVVLGGTDTISSTVAGQLPGVVRLAGVDRYATAALVAARAGSGQPTVIASGVQAHLVDALPGGALARPVLLVGASGVPTPTSARLTASNAPSVTVLGGPDVVPPLTARALAALLP